MVAGQLVQAVRDLGRQHVVGDDDDLEVLVGRVFDDAADAVLDQDDALEAHVADLPRGGDHDADQRLLGSRG